ncbi:MAG: glycoside hydrolase family 2 protein, partial [Bacteroidota bacterium]
AVELSSSTFVPDVWLEAPGVSHWSNNSISILPGRTIRVHYEGKLGSTDEINWRSWGVREP